MFSPITSDAGSVGHVADAASIGTSCISPGAATEFSLLDVLPQDTNQRQMDRI